MRWDVFISHASEDKESVAKPLALALKKMGLDVWYDEFTLSIGDRLRRSIDLGLAHSTYGVVILSPSFFAKKWPQRELDGLLALEDLEKKRILPVWHRVTSEDVKQFSPIFVDIVAVSTSRGISAVAQELCRVVGHNRGVVKTNRQTELDGIRIAEELEEIASGKRYTAQLSAVIGRALEYLFSPEFTLERGPRDGRSVYRLVPISELGLHIHSRYGVDYFFVFAINGEPTQEDFKNFRDFLASRMCRCGLIICRVFPKHGADVLRRRREMLRDNGVLIFFLGTNFLQQLLRMPSRPGCVDAFFKRLKNVELDILHGR